MTNTISLRIDGKWAVLPDDVEITIEGNSNIWDDKSGTCSYPFELNIRQNLHLVGNAAQLNGESIFAALDGKRGELFLMGVPFFTGIVALDDEVDLESEVVEINVKSGSLEFEKMIEGLNCQDVPLIDEIPAGVYYEKIEFEWRVDDNGHTFEKSIWASLPEDDFVAPVDVNGNRLINVSEPYPQKKFCNVRLCINGTGEYVESGKSNQGGRGDRSLYRRVPEGSKRVTGNPSAYIVLDAFRPKSGMCFYVLYFMDCLFNKLNVNVEYNSLPDMEDMNRLAFLNTRLSYNIDDIDDIEFEGLPSFYNANITARYANMMPSYSRSRIFGRTVKADSKNFPDIEVSEVIDALSTAFGIKLMYDSNKNSVRMFFVKELFDSDAEDILVESIYSVAKTESKKIRGFKLSYSSGSDDDTAFNYSDYQNVELKTYLEILNNISAYNKTCYIDENTGNAYRIKVNNDAESENQLFPSLFEVGAFSPASDGDTSDDNYIDKKEIQFSPVIMNDTSYKSSYRSSRGGSRDRNENDTSEVITTQTFAVFLDVDMQGEGTQTLEYSQSIILPRSRKRVSEGYRITYESQQIYDIDANDESPIQSYDTGFSLFLMRGPGNKSGVEEYDKDYDDEGNSKYVQVPKNYASSSDTVDNYGNLFDYNGEEQGGVDVSGRFSLKPRAEKPGYAITNTYAQRRGLADKFYSEYSYFVRNRKIAKISCKMELAEVINLSWEKKYRIGNLVGFLKSYTYTVTKDGIGPISLELYYM